MFVNFSQNPQLRQLRGSAIGSVAFRVPTATGLRAVVEQVEQAVSQLDDVVHKTQSRDDLSAVGRDLVIDPVRKATLEAIKIAQERVAALVEAREAEVAALLAVPAAKGIEDVMVDVEIRSRYGSLTSAKAADARRDERVLLALARSPLPDPSRDIAQKLRIDAIRARNADRFAALDRRMGDEECAVAALRAFERLVVAGGEVDVRGQVNDALAARKAGEARREAADAGVDASVSALAGSVTGKV